MSLEVSIRRGNGRFWGAAKRAARAVLSWHVPVGPATRPLFAALYRAHVMARELGLWTLRFLWFEPLFRSQCAEVGPGLRMEQLPYLVGRGRIVLGARVRLSGKSSIGFCNHQSDAPELVVGDGTFIGHGTSFGIANSVRIGRHCLIAGGVSIRDWDGHPVDAARRLADEQADPHSIRPVVLEDQVWIGSGARILKGVTIGARSIVGTGAVVTRDVPPDSVVMGNPAQVIRSMAQPGGAPSDAARSIPAPETPTNRSRSQSSIVPQGTVDAVS